MNKVAIIYWSNGGNVKVLAYCIAQGVKEAGAEVTIKLVSQAKLEDVMGADAVAFGSPSMDNNRIEQREMEPFINQFKLLPSTKKPTVLFGSYGWDDGQFMREWVRKMEEYGFRIVGDLSVKESPNKDELLKAVELGKMLVK